VAVSEHDEFEAVCHPQFFEDRGEVVAHRGLADEQALGDLPVVEAFTDEGDVLTLTLSE